MLISSKSIIMLTLGFAFMFGLNAQADKVVDKAINQNEMMAYDSTIKEDELLAYEQFVALYPKSEHIADVFQRVTNLRERDWKRATEDDIPEKYFAFCIKYPDNENLKVVSGTIKTMLCMSGVENPWEISGGKIVGLKEPKLRAVALYLLEDNSFREEIDPLKAVLWKTINVKPIEGSVSQTLPVSASSSEREELLILKDIASSVKVSSVTLLRERSKTSIT